MKINMTIRFAVAGIALAGVVATPLAQAQAKEQFVPLLSYRVGPFAAGGTGIFGGFIDYMQMVNARDGGVNGVKLTWEECETEYNTARGVECYERLKNKGPTGATVAHPLSTGITYGLIDRVSVDKVPLVTIGYGRTDAADGRVFPWVFPMLTTYWSQNTTMIKYIGQKEGGMDKLKGKKIAYIYHDSAYGKEGIPAMEIQAKKYGFEPTFIPVPSPGNEQQSQWLQIRQIKPDWVILWGWGVMNPTALKAAAKTGFPRTKMIGVWWSGSEEDTIPAGDAAKGFTSATFVPSGTNFKIIQDIQKHVVAKGNSNMDDKSRIGSSYYNRGVVYGAITVEAIRVAQQKYGKGKPMTGEQMRWGFENINLDDKRLAELGATGFMPTMKISCADHEGSGKVKYQQWDGKQFKPVSDWIDGDSSIVRPMIEESAAKYAKEKGITLRDCSKES